MVALSLSHASDRPVRVDLAEIIAAHAQLAPLRNEAKFALVTISDDGWSLEWPDGIDFGATQLRRWAGEQAGEIMAATAFRAWIDKHAMTLDRRPRRSASRGAW